jgi:hypothetical protein
MRKQLPLLIATAIGVALVIPATYAVLRAYDVLVGPPEPNPATPNPAVWSAHIAMFWRLWIGVYVAGMVAPLVYLAAKSDLPRTMRVLGTCVIVVAVMVGVQGLLMP